MACPGCPELHWQAVNSVSKRHAAAILTVLTALLLVANFDARLGYFSDDDLDTFGWVGIVPWKSFLNVVSPALSESNFRPVGKLAYRAIVLTSGLDFRRFVSFIQFVHVLNAALLLAVMRLLRISLAAAAGSLLFFSFHPATLIIQWKPMYVYELLCGLFCLLTLLLFLRGRIVLAAVAFWLAFKSKEIAVFLPVLLAGIEWTGERRWPRLTPFFAIAALFGVQAILQNRVKQEPYHLHPNLATMWKCLAFYASPVFGFRWSAAVLPAAALVLRDRRPLAASVSLFAILLPLLLLPGRLNEGYLYVPLIAGALAVGYLLERVPRSVIALACIAWTGSTAMQLRSFSRTELADASERRAYAGQLIVAAARHPGAEIVYADGLPANFELWGASGA